MYLKEKVIQFKQSLSKLRAYYKALFVGVVLFLVGGLSLTFFFSQETSGTAEAATELEALTSNIRRYFQNRPDYWGLSTQMVLDKNIYPNKMLKNNHLIGYFGNPVLVGNGLNADVLMPGARNFDIIYKDLNKKQCIGLASFKFSSQFWLGVTGITIINDDNKLFFTWDDKENSLPIQKNTAKDICDAKNTIIWHYEQ